MNNIYIKNFIFTILFFSYSMSSDPSYDKCYKTKLCGNSGFTYPDTLSNACLALAAGICFFTAFYAGIYKPYKEKKIRDSVKNMMLLNKSYISDLFYKYPGIINLYINNQFIANMSEKYYSEIIEIKKIFHIIIYEIMRLVKMDPYFDHLEKELANQKILLEYLIQDIILNEPFFMQKII
jgi:hypothetical protein